MRKFARTFITTAGCVYLIIGTAISAHAIPTFAKQQNLACTSCHSNYPRLNDFGIRFRNNGYQIPGKEKERNAVRNPSNSVSIHVAMIGSNDRQEVTEGEHSASRNRRTARISEVELLSGGTFARNVGYFTALQPRINGSENVAEQPGDWRAGNIVLSNLASRWLNIRAGRFAPTFIAYGPVGSFGRSMVISSLFPRRGISDGIEISGFGGNGFQYYLGNVDPADIGLGINDGISGKYIQLAKVFGPGEGQDKGARIRVMSFDGHRRTETYVRSLTVMGSTSAHRFGADASLNYKKLNLSVQHLSSREGIGSFLHNRSTSIHGSFAQLIYSPSSDRVAYLSYEDGGIDSMEIRTWLVGARYYPRPNIALQIGASRVTEQREWANLKWDTVISAVEIAF